MRAINKDRDVQYGHNAVLAQHVGVAEFRIVCDVLNRDRRAGLH